MARPKVFAVEFGNAWHRHARHLTAEELDGLSLRLAELRAGFGEPHRHSGLGLRKLRGNVFEFRLSRDQRVVFLFLKPDRLRLEIVGNHNDVARFLKSL